ncbi:MAG: group II intron reverse transcriptase domain-containing protein [Candidatus Pacebacteria bacterium]|nr:group II intron reverse transcriptase domain-containing protein [Candidatus Paceibacterota bacterium]
MARKIIHKYDSIISIENLLEAWQEFLRGKKKRKDVQEFEGNFMSNVLNLHNDLKSGKYKHSDYEHFKVSDPKPRDIHKAKVRDRLLHHSLYRVLYPLYDKKFSFSSFSCRNFKGTHKAIEYFYQCFLKESKNNTRTVWVLKCDIRKFFANIDQCVLFEILQKYIEDENLLKLLKEIISSFNSGKVGVGLPLGNLTSQLFVNIYMNEFDQFVKHKLKVKYYVRYCDDFVFLSTDKDFLLKTLDKVNLFLNNRLKLKLHPNKVSIKTFASGVDFLGWVHFPKHRVLRTSTKRRAYKKFRAGWSEESKQSYLGLLSHGNTYKIQAELLMVDFLLRYTL